MVKQNNKSKKDNGSSRIFFFSIVGLVVICIIAIAFLSKHPNKEVTFDYKDQPYLGKKDAPVKIVEFGDYKCPICKNFNESVLPVINKAVIQTGKAKLYFMNDPIINTTDSIRSAVFAETVYHELGNDKFWKFHDLLYSKQPEDSKYERLDVYTMSFLESTLKEIASDKEVKKVSKAFVENKYEKALEKDTSYVKKLNIAGTPTFYINGKPFKGQTYQDLIDTVNKAAKE